MKADSKEVRLLRTGHARACGSAARRDASPYLASHEASKLFRRRFTCFARVIASNAAYVRSEGVGRTVPVSRRSLYRTGHARACGSAARRDASPYLASHEANKPIRRRFVCFACCVCQIRRNSSALHAAYVRSEGGRANRPGEPQVIASHRACTCAWFGGSPRRFALPCFARGK